MATAVQQPRLQMLFCSCKLCKGLVTDSQQCKHKLVLCRASSQLLWQIAKQALLLRSWQLGRPPWLPPMPLHDAPCLPVLLRATHSRSCSTVLL